MNSPERNDTERNDTAKDDTEENDISLCLKQIADGDDSAVQRLLPMIYDDLRGLARKVFRTQSAEHTLQPTALVHEAYMRLAKPSEAGFSDRKHFFEVAAIAMRQVLTNHARTKNATKRGGGRARAQLDSADLLCDSAEGVDLERLDDALTKLQELDPKQVKIVELRFFSGLSVVEIAEIVNLSDRMVRKHLEMACAWLRRALGFNSD